MLKLRPLNNDRSTAGLASVSSQISHATKPTMAITVITTIRVEWNQSSFFPRSSIIWSAPTQTTSMMRPTLSIGRLRVGVSRLDRPRQQTPAQNRPTGTLIRKIQLQ